MADKSPEFSEWAANHPARKAWVRARHENKNLNSCIWWHAIPDLEVEAPDNPDEDSLLYSWWHAVPDLEVEDIK